MKISVDGKTTDMDCRDVGSFRTAIEQLKTDLRKDERVIVRVEEEDGGIQDVRALLTGKTSLEGIKGLNVVTKHLKDVMQGALSEIKNKLPDLIAAFHSISAYVRRDKVEEAIKAYNHMVSYLNLMIMGVVSIQQTYPRDLNFDPAQAAIVLKDISQALVQNNYSLFCDAIEYQFIPLLENLQEALADHHPAK